MTKVKTYHEIIDETIEHYSNNPRSIQNGKCHYLTSSGNKCALGRCLNLEKIDIKSVEGRSAYHVFSKYEFDEVLKPEYCIENKAFWQSLQRLHDTSSFWKKNRLSKDGKNYVHNIKARYNEG